MSATSSTNLAAAKGTHKGKIGVQLDAFIDLVDGFFSNTGKLSHAQGGVGVTNTVALVATPVFNYALGDVQKITLGATAVTSSTITNPGAIGSRLILWIIQDGTGSRTFTYPVACKGATAVGSAANAVTIQEFMYDGTFWRSTGVGVVS
jgi:hypothetical protein